MEGILKAKERGVIFGRQAVLDDDQVTQLRERRESGDMIKTLMKEYNLSKSSIYRYLNA
jgi:DNA invertase Pin-like site-specific DNA recombinase